MSAEIRPESIERNVARALYRLAQTARMGWYAGLYRLSRRISPPVPAAPELKARMPGSARLRAGLDALIARDIANIESGLYRAPDGLLPGIEMVRRAALYLADLRAVERRRRRRDGYELTRQRISGYPGYYLQNFHYQTDGYLSRRSAELYDFQVEVLFGGSADVMRRQALVPVAGHLRGRAPLPAPLLDVACGTGRFLSQVKSNWPRLPVVGIDLSPHYLDEAQRCLEPWSRKTLVQGAAETLPFAGGSFEIVASLYLLHELPRPVRHRALAEMARVLRPGGLLVLVDSLQQGDVPEFDALLEHFPAAFHEPYFADYSGDDMAVPLTRSGLRPLATELAYLSRVMSWTKPSGSAEISGRSPQIPR
jgi:ubiquinone/menaquinone biosynthesis C-methylase UbiE